MAHYDVTSSALKTPSVTLGYMTPRLEIISQGWLRLPHRCFLTLGLDLGWALNLASGKQFLPDQPETKCASEMKLNPKWEYNI